MRNDCFARLRAELGEGFGADVGRRLHAVAGDVSTDGLGLDEAGRAALASCDVVIHSAATVSFDAPLDHAVEVNLLGPSRVAAAVAQARADGGGPSHLIAVSTAYVSGMHQGETAELLLSEDRFSLAVDWKAEVASSRRLRDDMEDASRHPDRLREFMKRAHGEQGASGTHLLAARAEKFREEWVKRQLIDAGSARAQALGWPDAYAFTKALGERALVAQHGPASTAPVPLSIVRPSIIESALAEPRPGWIRGFRMAEPIIISYARGLLKEFPGVAEGVIDVIPVDLVVAAILAVAAHGPSEAEPSVYHVASGVRNPLAYGQLVSLAQDWFGRHPLYDERGQPISVPEWSFPGRGRVQRQLRQATRLMATAERALTMVPMRHKQAEWAAKLEERQTLASRALGYVELYGAYTETEARYRIDHLLALWDTLDEHDQATFCFDPAVIDWDHYVAEVHFPSVVERGRVRTSPVRQSGPDRETRMRSAVLSADRHLAVFDLEHTLIASNVVDSYAWLASRYLHADSRVTFVADLLGAAPGWLALDRRDRGDFLRSFYRRYEGASAEQVRTRRLGPLPPVPPPPLVPGRPGPGTPPPPARTPHVAHHRRARSGGGPVCAPLRRRGVRPAFRARRSVHRSPGRAPPDRRGPGAVAGPLRDRARPLARPVGRLRRLLERPGHAGGGRLPGRRQPRLPAGRHRPSPGLAGRTLEAGLGGQRPLLADRLVGRQVPRRRHRSRWVAVKALLFERSLPRFAASTARFGAGVRTRGQGGAAAPGRRRRPRPARGGLASGGAPPLGHLRVRSGHLGRPQLALLRAPGELPVRPRTRGGRHDRGPASLRPMGPSWPPVRGWSSSRCWAAGPGGSSRRARRVRPATPATASTWRSGTSSPGIQTGFCADTGGGWSTAGLVAHESQLYAVPDILSDADAVTIEPMACALHAVLAAPLREDHVVAVLGAGTLGLATVAAFSHLSAQGLVPVPTALLVGARYAKQQTLATELGASAALGPDQLPRAVRRHSRSMATGSVSGGRLTGGADVVFDCVGSAESIGQSLAMVRPRGTVVLVGMPGRVTVDLASLWHREVRLVGAYAYGTETVHERERSTFDLAIDTVTAMRTGRLVSATYPLDRFEEAVAHAGAAGRRGAVKIAFDLRATSKGARR